MNDKSSTPPELLPCPFCGTAPVEDRIEPHKHYIAQLPDYPGSWSIECVKCEFRIFDHDARENAVRKWNTRQTRSEIAPTQADLNSEYCRGREEGYEAGMLFEQQRQVRSVTQQIPDGWRLVPEEATDEMMEHFAGTPMCSLPHSRRAKERRAYRDMLDVTPIAPSGLPPSAKTLRKD